MMGNAAEFGQGRRPVAGAQADAQAVTITDDFGDMLNHDLTWEQRTGADDYGKPTFAAPQVLKARTDFVRKNRVSAQGTLFESSGESWFAPVGAAIEDRFTLHTGEVVQNLDVSPIDDDLAVPYATRLIFG